MSVSELIRQTVMERIEDEYDLDAYDKAMEEHLKNPVVYSQKEVQKMLDPVASPRQGWATAFKRMRQAGEDKLIFPADLDAHLLEEWDEN